MDEVTEFFKQHMDGIIYSTSAREVDIFVDVYNVTGSSDDPHLGHSWKGLLEEHGIYGPCYVTNQKPDKPDTSHDKGSWLGGHMALTMDGVVETGGTSYLMPLCAWHNSTKRNEKNFEHTKTKMLKLNGFMKGETAFTFNIRRKDLGAHRIIVKSSKGWEVVTKKSLDDRAMTDVRSSLSVPAGNPFIILSLDRSKERLIVTDTNIKFDRQIHKS